MDLLFFDIAVIVGVSALLAWVALLVRQPIIIAYVLCGILLGPWGLETVSDTEAVHSISQIGVALLLFMAGLVLHPQRLAQLFRRTAFLTLGGCFAGWVLSFGFLVLWGFAPSESALAAVALMFSSTILITKLLPTTTLHQRHMGAMAIAVLIAQDIIAVGVILVLAAPSGLQGTTEVPLLLATAVILSVVVLLAEQVLLRRMMLAAERFNEVLLLLCIGWCLAVAACAHTLGLTYEVGAFLAGVALARGKLAYVLSEELKPLRDFFLVLFFFVLGAQLDFLAARDIWLPALLLAILIVVTRPLYYAWLMRRLKEKSAFARELGYRMSQASEFGLIICTVATANGKMAASTAQLAQLATVVTMIVSTYLVVMKLPTPIGTLTGLKKD